MNNDFSDQNQVVLLLHFTSVYSTDSLQSITDDRPPWDSNCRSFNAEVILSSSDQWFSWTECDQVAQTIYPFLLNLLNILKSAQIKSNWLSAVWRCSPWRLQAEVMLLTSHWAPHQVTNSVSCWAAHKVTNSVSCWAAHKVTNSVSCWAPLGDQLSLLLGGS